MSPRTLFLLSLLVAFSYPAFARESARDRRMKSAAKKFVSKLRKVDESLFGETWYGMYMQGRENVGKAKFTVRKGEGKAAYEMVMETTVTVKGHESTRHEVLLVEKSLALISRKMTGKAKGKTRSMNVRLDKRLWVCEWVLAGEGGKGERRFRSELRSKNKDHGWNLIYMILARKLDRKKSEVYMFQGIKWPNPPEGERGSFETDPTYRNVKIRVSKPENYDHRGKKVQASTIKVMPQDEIWLTFVVDEEGRLLSCGPESGETRYIAGTEEQCSKDLPAGNELADENGAKAALRLFMRVLAQEEELDVLDQVVDWKACHAEAAKTDKNVEGMGVDVWTLLIKAQLWNLALPLDNEQIDELIEQMKPEMDGDSAVFRLPSVSDNPAHFQRRNGKWMLVKLPR